MTDKDIIRKEVERLMAEEMEIYKSANKDGDGDASAAPVVYTRLQMILSFIDSMKEELGTARTVCDEYCAICPHNTCKIKMRREEEPIHRTQADIEAAMTEVEEKSKDFTEAHRGESADEILAAMRGEEPAIPDIVDEHFYEMIGFKPASKDLEEAAEHFAFHQTYSGDMEYIAENEKEAFKAGANWQKQQMMKNAVGASVTARWPLHSEPLYCSYEMYIPYAQHLSEGDKVNLIIIKED